MAPSHPGTRFGVGTRNIFSPNWTPAPAPAPAQWGRAGIGGRPAICEQFIDLLSKLFAKQVIGLLSELFAEQVIGLLSKDLAEQATGHCPAGRRALQAGPVTCSATDSKELNNLSNEFLLIGQMSSDMGSNNLFDPMSEKLIEPGCPTRDRTQLSDPMSDKPTEPGLFDMASDRIVQSHVGQTCWTGFSDTALDNCV
ncbi:hypothetical protein PCASD_05906 [Puccinia coronata f. sp. avenae]|uniref:Uncharacterized protein n=1 Tax=Puccinia coronata f. sp. avenae TaxID=200324 RepID=A0A2N5V673_9BASI|nr:hypothetical protein PCASD_05906 [Puccinia coronata f. sp. avenae]